MPQKDEMYNRVDWMTPADQEILQILSTGLWLSPANIAENTGYGDDWVRKRCSEMSDRRILERKRSGDPFYRITGLGEDILNRNIQPEEVERQTVILSDYELINEE